MAYPVIDRFAIMVQQGGTVAIRPPMPGFDGAKSK